MRILSVQQPWSWLIVHGLKDIENRDWTHYYRGPLLIHAGKKLDPGCFDGDELHTPALWQAGAGLDIRERMPQRKGDFETGGIVGIVDMVDIVTQSKSPWFVGRYGFVLKNAQPLPFIPLRGQIGLFDAPNEVLEIVRKECERKAFA